MTNRVFSLTVGCSKRFADNPKTSSAGGRFYARNRKERLSATRTAKKKRARITARIYLARSANRRISARQRVAYTSF